MSTRPRTRRIGEDKEIKGTTRITRRIQGEKGEDSDQKDAEYKDKGNTSDTRRKGEEKEIKGREITMRNIERQGDQGDDKERMETTRITRGIQGE